MKNISVNLSLENIFEGDYRLDATYYASSVFNARKYIENYLEKGNTIKKIGDLSQRTFNPPPIKRIFTDDTNIGTAYMLPQEMFDFYWEPKKYVISKKMDNIDDWYLKENWVVLTQSGSVGKPYYATYADEKNILSQNAIRIAPKDDYLGGYIYAYLSTWIGQTLLKKDEFGITVKHIRPNQVDEIPIPDIEDDKKKIINEKIKQAFELRNEAINLINEAKKIIYNELNAPYNNLFNDEFDE